MATSSSCSSGSTAMILAPVRATRSRTAVKAAGSVAAVGVRTQAAPGEQVGVGALDALLPGRAGHRVPADESGGGLARLGLDGPDDRRLDRPDVGDGADPGVEGGDHGVRPPRTR